MGKNSSDPKALINQPIPAPVESGKTFVEVEGYWVNQGSLEPITPDKVGIIFNFNCNNLFTYLH